jgi:hypothetical protein
MAHSESNRNERNDGSFGKVIFGSIMHRQLLKDVRAVTFGWARSADKWLSRAPHLQRHLMQDGNGSRGGIEIAGNTKSLTGDFREFL